MKIPWRRKWQPTPVLLPRKFHGRRSLVGYGPWGHKESDTTEPLHFLLSYKGGFQGGSVVKNPPARTEGANNTGSIPGLGRSPGVGNGNPLQYSCLENCQNIGAWFSRWGTVDGGHKELDMTAIKQARVRACTRAHTHTYTLPNKHFKHV